MSYGKVKDTFWTDKDGRRYPVPPTGRRLRPHNSAAEAALRAHVFRRDNFTCRKCGMRPTSIPHPYDGRSTMFSWSAGGLHLDHVHPRSKGGSNHPANLQTLCHGCNSGKCDRISERVAA